MSYDQWKTASPYDDEPDFVEEAEKWMKRHADFEMSPNEDERDLWWMIKGLCDYIEEYILGVSMDEVEKSPYR